MEERGFLNSGTCPLLRFASLQNETLERDHVSLPFDAFKMDGCALNLVAPDHPLTGLFKGVLLIFLIQFPEDEASYRVKISLKDLLAKFGFQSQLMLYKRKKRKLVPRLSISCLLYTSPSPRDQRGSRMPSSA